MRSLKLGLMTIGGLVIAAACGGTERAGSSGSDTATGGAPAEVVETAGAAGESAGAIEVPDPVPCGVQRCAAIILGETAVSPCCADPSKGICGADVSALLPGMGCQPLTQAGALDRGCPSSMASSSGLPLPPAPGCCREATGQCGYWVSNLGGLLPFAPGCVDPSSLGSADAPRACGSGVNDMETGGRGSGGAGGESSASGGAAAGAAGAAGAPANDAPPGGESGGGAAPAP